MMLKPTMDILDFFEMVYRRYPRYWFAEDSSRYSLIPEKYPQPWDSLLRALSQRPPGRALDLGAGEGSDAIRLARMGFVVDAVEGTAVGAEKIERYAREAGVHVNVINADVRQVALEAQYDVVLCNGVLHYVNSTDRQTVLARIQNATAPGGYNMVMAFTDYTPVPECHQVISVYCDQEDGSIKRAYENWPHEVVLTHNKPETSHPGFPPHAHSMVKVLARKPAPAE